MAYPSILVHAPIFKSPTGDGGRPVVLFERDPRHPEGEVFLAEGDEARVYRTTAVQSAIGSGKLVEGTLPKVKDASGKAVPKIDPESLGSLGLETPTREAITKLGIQNVSDLVAKIEAGDLGKNGGKEDGIGPARLEEITVKLVKADRIKPPTAS